MSDIILPESYLMMTVIIIKLEVELYETPFFKFIRRILLKSRLEDFYFTRSTMIEVQLLRGDMLYKSIPTDSVIVEYLYINSMIDIYEKMQYKMLNAAKAVKD